MRRLWADSRPRGALFVLLSVGPVLAAGWRARIFVRTVSIPPTGADMTRSDHALAALEVDAFDGT